MMDGSLILALVSTGAAVLNSIGILMTWMKYRILAYESLIFASEVLGALHGRRIILLLTLQPEHFRSSGRLGSDLF